MSNEPMLSQLGQRWPETANYLERIGQINNDLQVLSEMRAAEGHIPDFLERLAIDTEDIVKQPEGLRLLALLHRYGVTVQEAMTVPGFREAQNDYQEQQRLYADDPKLLANLLDSETDLWVKEQTDQQILALPELQTKLQEWAVTTLSKYQCRQPLVTFIQAVLIVHLVEYLDQEKAGSELREDSLRSLLSTSFYERAEYPM